MRVHLLLLLVAGNLCTYNFVQAQDIQSTQNQLINFPTRFIDRINHKAATLEARLNRQTEKYLERLQKKEAKLKRKLARIDSTAANNVFNADAQYTALINKMKDPATGVAASHGEYLANLDSLKSSLSFLQQNKQLLSSGSLQNEPGSSLSQVNDLQSKLQQADEVKAFIRQRREQIRSALSQYSNLPGSIPQCFGDYNKECYYYSEQVREYKELLNDPDKLEQKALSLLNKLPAFQQFMKEHSELAGLFSLPANYGNPQALAGLQTRSQVQQLIQNQVASGGPNAQAMLQQNLQSAQAQLSQFKDKINTLGGGSGDMDMPDFKPNTQRTKTFFQRLEYGSNLQTTHASYFFPTTTDLGLSVGYKINNNNTIGIGASYKLGWGKDIQHIAMSSEGASLRSFLDMKLKGSFYVSGGWEYNYQPLAGLNSPYPPAGGGQGEAWQQSGLVGLSKIISVKSKLFKKTKLQLLWDFLSYEQAPRTQPIKFRVGYAWR